MTKRKIIWSMVAIFRKIWKRGNKKVVYFLHLYKKCGVWFVFGRKTTNLLDVVWCYSAKVLLILGDDSKELSWH